MRQSYSQSRLSAGAQARSRPAGLGPSAVPLTIVYGPCCGGKSTYVEQHRQPGDLVIDLDVIAGELVGKPICRERSPALLEAAIDERNRRLRDLQRLDPAKVGRVWFLIAAPDHADREWWRAQLQPEAMVLVSASVDECINRLIADPSRFSMRATMRQWIVDWHNRYRRTAGGTL